MEGNALVSTRSQTFPEFQGSGNYNYYRTKWLLLDAIDALEKNIKRTVEDDYLLIQGKV